MDGWLLLLLPATTTARLPVRRHVAPKGAYRPVASPVPKGLYRPVTSPAPNGAYRPATSQRLRGRTAQLPEYIIGETTQPGAVTGHVWVLQPCYSRVQRPARDWINKIGGRNTNTASHHKKDSASRYVHRTHIVLGHRTYIVLGHRTHIVLGRTLRTRWC